MEEAPWAKELGQEEEWDPAPRARRSRSPPQSPSRVTSTTAAVAAWAAEPEGASEQVLEEVSALLPAEAEARGWELAGASEREPEGAGAAAWVAVAAWAAEEEAAEGG